MAFGLIFGSFNGLGTILSFIFGPFDFNAADISLIGISLILFGVIGAIAASFYLKNHKIYRKFIIVLLILSIGCMFLIFALA